MVFRGKPSGACERCRARRLKCDFRVPSCTPCIRAKILCAGYRNPLDLGFRDQSDEVIRNYRMPERRNKPPRPTTTIFPCPGTSARVSSSPSSGIPQPVRDVAACHFFANYVTGGPHHGHLSFLLPLIQDARNSAVNAAVNAVALAGLSNIRLSPQTLLKAQREYTTALREVNEALQDEALCKRDETLATVVLLGIFEIMACTDDAFIDRWMKHMDGAAQVLEVRGADQLCGKEGLGMFTHLRTQITLCRMFQERHSPLALSQLTEQVKQYRAPKDRILDDIGAIVTRLTNFVADAKSRHITEASEIIRTALSIDAELISLMLNVPPDWSYTTKIVPEVNGSTVMSAIWGGRYHIYKSLASAGAWNNYRSCRIVIQELILNTLADMDSSIGLDADSGHPQEHFLANQCRQTMVQLAEDICASVPFSLGSQMEHAIETADLQPWNSAQPPSSGSSSLGVSPDNEATSSWSSDGETTHSHATPPCSTRSTSNQTVSPYAAPASFEISGAGGLALMWPLLVAANSGVASDDIRNWIIFILEKIGHSMGINQSLSMANLLRNRRKTRSWLPPEPDAGLMSRSV